MQSDDFAVDSHTMFQPLVICVFFVDAELVNMNIRLSGLHDAGSLFAILVIALGCSFSCVESDVFRLKYGSSRNSVGEFA